MDKDFYVFPFDSGTPTMSITKNGVVFSKGVVCRLNRPRYCVCLIDKNEKRIAIKPCKKEEPHSYGFYNPNKKQKTPFVRWNSKCFMNEITSMTDCDFEYETYKVIGDYHRKENIIIFDLKIGGIK